MPSTARRRFPGALACAITGVLLTAGTAVADSAHTGERTVTRLADGVYTIRHPDPYPGFVHGNTTVIVGTREVLVVDSCMTAAAAAEDIAQIRAWTDRPVRYVVNTHWHQDHNGGNAAYLAAYPGVTILAHRETLSMLDATSPHFVEEEVKSVEQASAEAKAALATGKGPDGKPMSARRRGFLEGQVSQAAPAIEQVRVFTYQPPTLTFDDSLTVDLGGRQVVVEHPGRGNTGGDVVVFLPAEKILVAGDLLVHPVPYFFDGYPREWSSTLDALAALEPAIIVPGHGEVQRDTRYLFQVRDLIRAVVTQVEAQAHAYPEPELDAVKKRVDVKALETELLGDDTDDRGFLDYAVDSLVGLAFHQARLR